MNRVCVDASVAVRWLVPEAGHAAALELLDEWREVTELWAPDLLYAECANALRRRVASGALSLEDACAMFRELLAAEFRTLTEREVAEEALSIAVGAGLTVWDASYVVVARRVGAELWTADRQLHTRGRQAYPAIQLLVP